MLNDAVLRSTLRKNITEVLTNRQRKSDEGQSPEDAIKEVAEELSSAITEAVTEYVKGAVVSIGPENISVTSTTGPCVVASLTPAKLR